MMRWSWAALPLASATTLASWCRVLRSSTVRQPCWGAGELRRRSRVSKARTLGEKLAWGASAADGRPISPSEGGQDLWLWDHHLRWLRRPIAYADFGSNDWLHTSNTYFLDACVESAGVCVEASAHYAGGYATYGRNCTLVTACLSDAERTVEWAEFGGERGGSTRSGVLADNKSWRNFKNKSRVARLAKRCTTGAAARRPPPRLAQRRRGGPRARDPAGHAAQRHGRRRQRRGQRRRRRRLPPGAGRASRRARGHFDDYTRPGFALLAPAAWRDERCAAPGEDTALSPSAPRRCGVTRLLRCSLKNPAGFGFRVAVLNGCLRAATLLNATLLFDRHTFYRTRAGYGIDERTSDGLLWLDAGQQKRAKFPTHISAVFRSLDGALPNGTALAGLRTAGCLEPDGFEMALPGPARRGGVEAWWAAHGAAIARDLRFARGRAGRAGARLPAGAAGAASTLPAYAASRFPSSAVVIDNDAFNDLAHFAFADVVARASQFPLALALSRGVALRPADFRGRSPVRFDAAHAAACHVAVDGAAASARLAAALADPACANRRETG
ncbi:hypothetical protein JL722_11192 [Aureococcus anophagefferens]|nr:hypothetical protein JL722_11192 [Aureococcus anophagefferens]